MHGLLATNEFLGMPLMPHLYAIPITLFIGVALGWLLRGVADDDDLDI